MEERVPHHPQELRLAVVWQASQDPTVTSAHVRTTVRMEETAQLIVETSPPAAALQTSWETSASIGHVMDSVTMEGHVCSPAMAQDNVAALHASSAITVKWTSVTIAVMESVFPPTSTSRMETLHAGVPVAESSRAVIPVKDTVLTGSALLVPQTSHSANVLWDGRVIAVRILLPM